MCSGIGYFRHLEKVLKALDTENGAKELIATLKNLCKLIFRPENLLVDVTGTSKGKGFAGVIKRWNQSRGPMTHGSTYHRRVGSLGPMRPMRVLKGKKLPGHLGNETVTIQNLEIISVDTENNCLLISGNIPGPKGGYVLIRTAVKGGKNTAAELVSYVVEEEPVVENTEAPVTEEVTENITEEVAETSNEEVKEAE